MFNLQMVIEFLQKLNALVTSVDNLDNELEDIKSRLHNLETGHSAPTLLREGVEAILDGKDFAENWEVDDKICDALTDLDIDNKVEEAISNVDIDDKVEDAIHNTDWNDKVHDACQGFSWSINID